MTDIKDDDVTQLINTIKGLSLPGPQRQLMNAIIQVAADIRDETVEVPERAFTEEFVSAFTPKQAGLVLKYAAAVQQHAIIRQPTDSIIHGSATRPAAIIKAPPGSDD